ncbi:MAG: hypothetical protein UV74_C0001G0083 [Candidatus Woesebacteria bacterium GW2011_GWB1_43_14]|uniref:Uncharacterized protein n=1 Tax=Candidatus Woesebacteria bacterium GW2011_GWB1_43_14 TaxID=1618578 RepID=A0A0G1GJL9_9BACT|nr:MAG: hypothetical protein UV51_C0002G0072 [Candidatus Woesebacteria bacterium GW2011_GWC1_42_9]KKS98973.1 MAG: hypothetical protein UV74_C0001G0083 [Candidatus Woesebacteria bacterium GW2011_GWB1_43_14]
MTIWEMLSAFVWWVASPWRVEDTKERTEDEPPFEEALQKLGKNIPTKADRDTMVKAAKAGEARERLRREKEGERLDALVREHLVPILVQVSRSMLGGEGEIEISKSRGYESAGVSISWDQNSNNMGGWTMSYGNTLGFTISSEIVVDVYAGRKHPQCIGSVSLRDEKWKGKIESLVLSAIRSGKCGWSESYDPWAGYMA